MLSERPKVNCSGLISTISSQKGLANSTVPSVDPESTRTISTSTDWLRSDRSAASTRAASFLVRTTTLGFSADVVEVVMQAILAGPDLAGAAPRLVEGQI
jgi:hypothetical protein